MKEPSEDASDEEFAKWVESLSDKELRKQYRKFSLLRKEGGGVLEGELRLRAAKKHWSLTPGFIVMLIGAVFAGFAAWPTFRDSVWPWIERKYFRIELVPALRTKEPPTPTATPSIAASPLPPQETSSPDATPRSGPQTQALRR